MSPLFPSARLYDLDDGRLTEDIPLYLGFAAKTGGPVLELGIGTGRIAMPLARAGYHVTGLDISWPLIRKGQTLARREGLSHLIQFIHADFCEPPLASERFALAFCAYNAFLHLIDSTDQLAALQAWYRVLRPGGVLVMDVENPSLAGLALLSVQRGFEPEETLVDPETGEIILKSTRVEVELSDQVLAFERRYEGGQGDARWEVEQPFRVRILFQRELATLLMCAGFVHLRFYGDYELNPWEPESPRIIAVAERPRDEGN